MYDKPNPDQISAPTFTERPPDVYADCRSVLVDWRKQQKPWPRMMDNGIQAAARWWVDEMQEPWNRATEMPRLTSVQGNSDKQRWISPYQDRVVQCLRIFLLLPEARQRIVVAARQDGFWWRGEYETVTDWETGKKVWCFSLVLREYERQQQMGRDEYRKHAIARMRRMKAGGRLPYDKHKQYA